MSVTLAIMDDVLALLKGAFPDLEVEYFPESAMGYRLNHPKGALLLGYANSKFGKPLDLGAVLQQRDMTLRITVIYRQLNGREGAIALLDKLRETLIGYQPIHCRRRLYAANEPFVGNINNLWQYALDVATETMQVQSRDDY